MVHGDRGGRVSGAGSRPWNRSAVSADPRGAPADSRARPRRTARLRAHRSDGEHQQPRRALRHQPGRLLHVWSDRYVDRDLDRSWFNRFRADFRQFIPIVNNARQLALRLHFDDLAPEAGQDVPFYMQPTLGGGYWLRSLPSYRLRDRSLVLFQAEYRIQANPFITTAIFYDTGTVAPRPADLDFGNMTHDWGSAYGPATWRRPRCGSIWRSAKRDRGSCSSSPMHSERIEERA